MEKATKAGEECAALCREHAAGEGQALFGLLLARVGVILAKSAFAANNFVAGETYAKNALPLLDGAAKCCPLFVREKDEASLYEILSAVKGGTDGAKEAGGRLESVWASLDTVKLDLDTKVLIARQLARFYHSQGATENAGGVLKKILGDKLAPEDVIRTHPVLVRRFRVHISAGGLFSWALLTLWLRNRPYHAWRLAIC